MIQMDDALTTFKKDRPMNFSYINKFQIGVTWCNVIDLKIKREKKNKSFLSSHFILSALFLNLFQLWSVLFVTKQN